MKSDSEALSRRLHEIKWFQQINLPLGEVEGVGRLPDGDSALKYCDSHGWIGILRTESEKLAEHLQSNSLCGMNEWNIHITEYVQDLYPLIDEQVARLQLNEEAAKRVRSVCRWTLPNACIEAHFLGTLVTDEAWPKRFFQSLAEWYLRGRFPCGLIQREEQMILLVF